VHRAFTLDPGQRADGERAVVAVVTSPSVSALLEEAAARDLGQLDERGRTAVERAEGPQDIGLVMPVARSSPTWAPALGVSIGPKQP
jgi:hypothetical protein